MKRPMDGRVRLVLTVLAPFFWFLFLISISLFMLHWRAVNEPGIRAADYVGLRLVAWLAFLVGLSGTTAITAFFIKRREKRLWIVIVAFLAATLVYAPFFALTVVMML